MSRNWRRKLYEDKHPLVQKAGIIPILPNGKAAFMVSSNARYGGADPAIAKGHVERGESLVTAAAREAYEELGLKASNFTSQPRQCWSGEIEGQTDTYEMTVFVVPIENTDFDQPHFETGKVVWMTREEFSRHGREIHKHIVDKAFELFDRL